MKILITGGSGLLGKSLIETRKSDVEIVATYLGGYAMKDDCNVRYLKLDVRDQDSYFRLFEDFKPKVTIHTACIGSPDYADLHKEETLHINVGGTRNMIDLCERFDSTFIYISSNGIYDGERAPYGEEDIPHPVNYYGEIKLMGEEDTLSALVPRAIIRPILMYGWNHPFERPNIITHSLAKLRQKETVFAYDDVYLTPLFAQSCATAIWTIIRKKKYEIFNIAGSERVNIYQLVQKAADSFQLDRNRVQPVQQGFFNELVKRPRDTSYRTEKMQSVLGIRPLSLTEGLGLMKVNEK